MEPQTTVPSVPEHKDDTSFIYKLLMVIARRFACDCMCMLLLFISNIYIALYSRISRHYATYGSQKPLSPERRVLAARVHRKYCSEIQKTGSNHTFLIIINEYYLPCCETI